MKKFIVLLLALAMCLPLFSGCSKPPELSSVKSELIALLEESYKINDILFGAGLVTEYDQSGLVTEYTDEIKNYESYYSDEEIYYEFFSPVVESYMKDTDGDGVGDTEVKQYTTITQIKDAASKVYTQKSLSAVLRQAFEGGVVTSGGKTVAIKPRYREDPMSDETETEADGSVKETVKVLRKYKFISDNDMNYIDSRGGRTVYDYNTMKIVSPSDGDSLVVAIAGWYQDYTSDKSSDDPNDWKTVPAGYSWHMMKLYFVKQGSEWKLDSPTY